MYCPTVKKELYNEALVYSSVVFGMGFWIDDQGLFLSAPEFKDGSLDIDTVSYTHLTLPTKA